MDMYREHRNTYEPLHMHPKCSCGHPDPSSSPSPWQEKLPQQQQGEGSRPPHVALQVVRDRKPPQAAAPDALQLPATGRAGSSSTAGLQHKALRKHISAACCSHIYLYANKCIPCRLFFFLEMKSPFLFSDCHLFSSLPQH